MAENRYEYDFERSLSYTFEKKGLKERVVG